MEQDYKKKANKMRFYIVSILARIHIGYTGVEAFLEKHILSNTVIA